MERMISLSRSCEASFEAVSEVLRRDSTQAIRIAGVGAKAKDSRTTVHVHPHRPWRSTDVEVSPTIGRLETVDSSTVRVNLSWRASGSKHVPGVTGHLEVRRLSSTACEFHYVGTYDPGGSSARCGSVLSGDILLVMSPTSSWTRSSPTSRRTSPRRSESVGPPYSSEACLRVLALGRTVTRRPLRARWPQGFGVRIEGRARSSRRAALAESSGPSLANGNDRVGSTESAVFAPTPTELCSLGDTVLSSP